MADVIEQDPNAPVVPPGQGETVTMSKAEADSLRRELSESRESERYWANAARGNGHRAEPPAQQVDDGPQAAEFIDDEEQGAAGDEDTPAKFVDDLAAKGLQAITGRGLVTAKQAQQIATEAAIKVSRELIGRERQSMNTDHTLMTEFPELKDQTSPLFKETAIRYQKAIAMDPSAMKTPAALYLAADAARECLRGKAPKPGAEEDDDYVPERESDRRLRGASQDGRTRTRPEATADDDYMGVEARAIAKSMGITDAEFKASRQELTSRPRGRR